jgi:hypothetical protein
MKLMAWCDLEEAEPINGQRVYRMVRRHHVVWFEVPRWLLLALGWCGVRQGQPGSQVN